MGYLACLRDSFFLVVSFVPLINSSFYTHCNTRLKFTLKRNAVLALSWPLSMYHLIKCNLIPCTIKTQCTPYPLEVENNIQPSITKSFDFMESVSVDEINCN